MILPPGSAITAMGKMNILNSLGSVGVALLIVGVVVGDLRPLLPGFGPQISQASILIAAGLCLAPALLRRRRFQFTTTPFIATFWTLLLSDWFARGFTLFQGPGFRGELIAAGLLSWALISQKIRINFSALLAIFACTVSIEYFRSSHGIPLLMDDCGVFFFRLELLKRFFPNIPFYYTPWDAGLDARDFFATGALNLYFLYWPLVRFFPLHESYNFIIVGAICVVPVISVFFASRLLELSAKASAIAGTLALASSLQWFKWGLKFGTLGFLTSAALFPLMLGLYYRLFAKDRDLSLAQACLLVIVSTLVFLWPLGSVLAAPIGVMLFFYYKRIATKRLIVPVIIALTVINAPWIMIFTKVSQVGRFVSGKESTHSAVDYIAPASQRTTPTLAKFGSTIHDNFVGVNPLILAFAIPGVALLAALQRRMLVLACCWLLLLGIFVSPFKPQLELTRMFVVAALLASIPTAKFLESLLADPNENRLRRLSVATILGMIFITPFAATNAVRGRSMEKFQFNEFTLKNVAAFIEEHGGEGRTLFSGFVLHEFDGGHAAPLTLLTSKPIVASSFAHNQWSYKQVFPESFLNAKDAGINRYLDLMNATLVLAHEGRWIKYFDNHANDFRSIGTAGPFHGYIRLNYTPTYLLEGNAKVAYTEKSVTVTPQTKDLTLKFRYFPFLKSSACTLSPSNEGEVSLIHLTDCPIGEEVNISSVGALQRIQQ